MNKRTYIKPSCDSLSLYTERLCLEVGSTGGGVGDGWLSNKKERTEQEKKKTIWDSSTDENNSTWLK